MLFRSQAGNHCLSWTNRRYAPDRPRFQNYKRPRQILQQRLFPHVCPLPSFGSSQRPLQKGRYAPGYAGSRRRIPKICLNLPFRMFFPLSDSPVFSPFRFSLSLQSEKMFLLFFPCFSAFFLRYFLRFSAIQRQIPYFKNRRFLEIEFKKDAANRFRFAASPAF